MQPIRDRQKVTWALVSTKAPSVSAPTFVQVIRGNDSTSVVEVRMTTAAELTAARAIMTAHYTRFRRAVALLRWPDVKRTGARDNRARRCRAGRLR